jgi:cysteine desulfurase
MPRPVYMDHHATTPVLPEVLEAMLPFFREEFGNASSTTHVYGKAASDAVEEARKRVAALFGALPAEIVFTGGATESDNLAIRGAAHAHREKGNHIITCAIEHEAVLETCRELEKEGFEVTYLPVDRFGMVDPGDVLAAMTQRTILVSLHVANNEIGTIEPIADVGRITREKGILLHTDAAQAAGRIPVDVERMNIDLLAMSAHKMYGPKGVGALYVRRKVKIEPLMLGGGQEKKRRSGTLNVPGIVGLGVAAEIAKREIPAESIRLAALRDALWERISASVDQIALNGHPVHRLPNNLNVTFRHVEGEALLMALREAAALSTGSACASGAMKGSYVLRALGVPEEDAHSSIRFGLGRCNTGEDVDRVVDRLVRSVARLREMSPLHHASPESGTRDHGL